MDEKERIEESNAMRQGVLAFAWLIATYYFVVMGAGILVQLIPQPKEPQLAPLSHPTSYEKVEWSAKSWNAQQQGGWRDLRHLGPEWSEGYDPGN